ncbi:uncharacterized protein LOC127079712 [Lathyrus oleraceus]|uniref:uncharacterized protein LOC127079712 n=1 Tax=Pisum sativum TaxID=3888 RepID=UPI0021D38348|nr:uncharacterized protein LOC127079712 [Pisum sativum]
MVQNSRNHENVNVATTRSQKVAKDEEEKETKDDHVKEVVLEVRENEKEEEEEVIPPVKPVEEKNKKEAKLVIKLRYPQRVTKKDPKEKDFEKFITMFKKLEINMPFFEALEQMPMYQKFMKEVIAKKRPIGDGSVTFNEKCSAISPVYQRLDTGNVSDTRTNLKFADHSIKNAYDIAEDVLVTIEKFSFPVDFVIIDIPEDEETHIILGRPFMRTSQCNFDIDHSTLTLKVYDHEITLNVLETGS